jgi:branched-chain amino acid transport system permease protein
MIVCVILGVTIERVAYRPLRRAPKIAALITAIGVSLFLENFASLGFVFGPNSRPFPRPFEPQNFNIGGVTITNIQIIIFVVSISLLALLQFIVLRTKIGMAMRAVSYDQDAARLMGINVDYVISVTFALGSALAGAGGVMWGLYQETITAHMGSEIMILVFIVVIIGGLGSIEGCFIGALLVGLMANYTAFLAPKVALISNIGLMVLILMWRPQGLYAVVKAK